MPKSVEDLGNSVVDALGDALPYVAAAVGFAIGGPQGAYVGYSLGKAGQAASNKRFLPSASNFTAEAMGRDQVVRSNVANRSIVYGRSMVSGPLVFAASSGAGNSVLHLVIPLAAHEIDAVEGVYFDDVLLTLDANGLATSAPYAGNAKVSKHLGVAGDPADADLVAANVGWTTAHKLSGVAYVVVKLTYNRDSFPTGIPNIKCVIRGRKLYDPRTGLTTWSQNPALAAYDYITAAFGLEATAGEIDTASVVAAANACDESVAVASGTEARYTANGVVDLGNTPRAILEDLLSAMNGHVVWSGGKYLVHAGAYTAPAVTITADDLRGGIKVRPRIARRELFNAVRGTYVSPTNLWQPADFPVVTNATYAAQDGNQVIWNDIQLPFTTSSPTAQRLAKLMLERSRQGITVELPLKLTAFKVATLDTVMVTIAQLGWAAKEFKVLEWKFSPEGGVDLTLQEETASSYAWNAGMETVVDTAPDTNLGNPWDVDTPTVLSLSSGTSELLLNGDGTVVSRIKATFPAPDSVFSLKAEIQFKRSADSTWQNHPSVDADIGEVWLSPVVDGAVYNTRIRFVNTFGVRSAWFNGANHTVIGKTAPPSTVGAVTYAVETTGIRLQWDDIADADRSRYEIRTTDSAWGGTGYVAYVAASEYLWKPQAAGSYTLYVRSKDTSGNYSTASSIVTVVVAAVPTPAVSGYTFADTSLTSASITLDWTDVAPQFGLAYYRVSYGAVSKTVNASTITLPADWLGTRTFSIVAVDNIGNPSGALSWPIEKYAPNPPTNLRAQVIDNNVLLYWDMPAKTSLPLQDVLLKKGSTWAGGEVIGNKSGGFTTLQELVAGTYTYWVAVRDTDNNYSTPVQLSAKVSEPPDFVFHGAFDSTLGGTKVSALLDQSGVVLPVNTSETFASHFTARGWAAPSDQVSAGFPVFIQPANGSGSYQEVFDAGTLLASSQITVSHVGEVVAGTPVAAFSIETSDDNATWSSPVVGTNAFATLFRYVRVTLSVTEATGQGLYRLQSMSVRLDAKLRSDAGVVSAVSSDASGTVFNFSKEFIDITALSLTASGTVAATAVYSFKDANIAGTYSVTSNLATVNCTAHDLVVGQKVRLNFATGTAPDGVYPVAGVTNANTYTVSITTANTSGNVSMYPNGARVYLFNASGTRISGSVSWALKGY